MERSRVIESSCPHCMNTMRARAGVNLDIMATWSCKCGQEWKSYHQAMIERIDAQRIDH